VVYLWVMKRLLLGMLLAVIFLPTVTQAQGLVPEPCSGTNDPSCLQIVHEQGQEAAGYGTCEMVSLVNNLIQFIVQMGTLVAVLVFVYAGFIMVTSQGDASKLSRAKGLFVNVVIGFVLILASFLIVNTILAGLLQTGHPAHRWQTIECVYPTAAADRDSYSGGNVSTATIGAPLSGVGVTGSATNDGSGVCPIITSGPCTPENLEQYFPGRAEEASRICFKESNGTPQMSGSDLCCGPGGDCSGAPSFSGGYFQINMLSETHRLPNCDAGFYNRNGSTAQGTCVRRNGGRICTGWSCSITDFVEYNQCRTDTMNSATNFQAASDLFRSRGFQPWKNSADLCGISYY